MRAPTSAPGPLEGAASAPATRSAAGLAADAWDPLGPVLRLDARPARRAGLVLGLASALLGHGIAAAAMSRLEAAGAFTAAVRAAATVPSEDEVDVDLSPAPPPAEALPLPPPEAPPPLPEARPAAPSAAATATPAPPPAAAVGAALTATPDPIPPDDPTAAAFSIVTSPGDRYAGGASERRGTAATAAQDPRARGDAPLLAAPRAPAAPPRRPPPRDLSRPAGVLGSTNWSTCPFPVEAEQAQIGSARVTLVVSVDAAGRARSAAVQSETPSGFGFAARARQCALARRFEPARGADGKPVAGTTPPLNIRFTQ